MDESDFRNGMEKHLFYLRDLLSCICGGQLCVWLSKWGDLQTWAGCLGEMLCRIYILRFFNCPNILIITFKTLR